MLSWLTSSEDISAVLTCQEARETRRHLDPLFEVWGVFVCIIHMHAWVHTGSHTLEARG